MMPTITQLLNNPLTEPLPGLLPTLQQAHGQDFEAYNVQPWAFNSTTLTLPGDNGWRLQNPQPLSIESSGRWNIKGLTWTLWLGKVVPMDQGVRSLSEWSVVNAELYGSIQRTIAQWCQCGAPSLPQGMPKPGGGMCDRRADTRTGRSNAITQYQVMAWSIENLNVEIG